MKIYSLESHVDIDANTHCWNWRGGTRNGYGLKWTRINGRLKGQYVHRLIYESHKGPIGELHVLHQCDNRRCINPDHLFLGTNQDNIADSVRKNRRKGVTRKRPSGLIYRRWSAASRIGHMKVKPEDRIKIKELVRSGSEYKPIAIKYGVSASLISRIASE